MEDDSAYEMLRGWFDEAEYTALGGGYDHQSIVVPDVGQGYLEAAAVYVDAFERIHLQASAGSKLCYSFVLTSVERPRRPPPLCGSGERSTSAPTVSI